MKRISGLTGMLAAIVIASAFAMLPASATSTVNIVTTNWKFTPSTIVLHVGQTTTLRLTSHEGVHGLQSADLGIPQTAIVPGTFKTVNVTPRKVGTYVLHCSIFCGAGHPNMTLTVKVVR